MKKRKKVDGIWESDQTRPGATSLPDFFSQAFTGVLLIVSTHYRWKPHKWLSIGFCEVLKINFSSNHVLYRRSEYSLTCAKPKTGCMLAVGSFLRFASNDPIRLRPPLRLPSKMWLTANRLGACKDELDSLLLRIVRKPTGSAQDAQTRASIGMAMLTARIALSATIAMLAGIGVGNILVIEARFIRRLTPCE
jgi:hypothetical protein